MAINYAAYAGKVLWIENVIHGSYLPFCPSVMLYSRGLNLARQAIVSGPPAPQNFAESSIDLNGPPQRLPLPLATGFVLLIHVFHIIPQVDQSFNVMETEVSK